MPLCARRQKRLGLVSQPYIKKSLNEYTVLQTAGRVLMRVLAGFSDYILPLVLFLILSIALMKKRPVYDEFTEGAKDGFRVVFGILPTLIGLMTGVGMLRASGFLNYVSALLAPVAEMLHFPAELLPLTVVKLFSSSAATGLVLDIFKEFGPDSYLGKVTSLICSSTETVFYTMSVYFMAAGVKKTRYTLAGALVATAVGIAVSKEQVLWNDLESVYHLRLKKMCPSMRYQEVK